MNPEPKNSAFVQSGMEMLDGSFNSDWHSAALPSESSQALEALSCLAAQAKPVAPPLSALIAVQTRLLAQSAEDKAPVAHGSTSSAGLSWKWKLYARSGWAAAACMAFWVAWLHFQPAKSKMSTSAASSVEKIPSQGPSRIGESARISASVASGVPSGESLAPPATEAVTQSKAKSQQIKHPNAKPKQSKDTRVVSKPVTPGKSSTPKSLASTAVLPITVPGAGKAQPIIIELSAPTVAALKSPSPVLAAQNGAVGDQPSFVEQVYADLESSALEWLTQDEVITQDDPLTPPTDTGTPTEEAGPTVAEATSSGDEAIASGDLAMRTTQPESVDDTANDIPQDPNTQVASSPRAFLIVDDGTGQISLILRDLPVLEPTENFWLWQQAVDGTVVPMTQFTPTTDPLQSIKLPMAGSASEATGFLITKESTPQPTVPSPQIILQGPK